MSMIRSSTLFLFVLVCSVLGCKDKTKDLETQKTEPDISVFYFIRHAEKDRTDPKDVDPELSQDGLGRAMHWAEILNDVPISAVYTTDFRRTAMTAAPIVVKKDLTVTYFDPETLDLEQFKKENLNKAVLVVGHRDTTPEMVNKLVGKDTYPTMDDLDNGSMYVIAIIDGKATASHLSFNCNCPKRR